MLHASERHAWSARLQQGQCKSSCLHEAGACRAHTLLTESVHCTCLDAALGRVGCREQNLLKSAPVSSARHALPRAKSSPNTSHVVHGHVAAGSAPSSEDKGVVRPSAAAVLLLCVLRGVLSPADVPLGDVCSIVVAALLPRGESGCLACLSRFSNSSCQDTINFTRK